MTARVFYVQQPARLITQADGSRKWIPSADLSPAEMFGPLIQILRPGNIYKTELYQAQAMVARKLEENQFTEDDFILPAGDPIAIALTVMVASARTGGRVKLLKYMPRTTTYEPYEINLEGNPYYARHYDPNTKISD
jgi:hypothetical protein